MMYWFEKIDYEAAKELASEELRSGRRHTPDETINKARKGGLLLTRQQLESTQAYDRHERIVERADDQGLLHARNGKWLEVRTWSNDIRGVTTLFGWGCYWMAWSFVASGWLDVIFLYSTGHRADGTVLVRTTALVALLNAIGFTLFAAGFTWAMQRYFFRYELLTQRWIRLRFNRETQKVYLLRPKYAGGLMVFDWSDTDPSLSKSADANAVLMHWPVLIWGSETELGKVGAMQFIGRRTSFKTVGDWMAFWEYIRRYMEEGPDAVPKPKTVIGYRPSIKEAWLSVTQWYPAFQQEGFIGKISDGISLLILPLIVLIFIGNFLGQCLTWQARFPEEIESAADAS